MPCSPVTGSLRLKEQLAPFQRLQSREKMSQAHPALTLIPKLLKIPPLRALSLFNASTQQGLQQTPQSISTVLHLLISSNHLPHAQSLLLQLISGRLPATLPSLLRHLPPPHSAPLYETIVNAHLQAHSPQEALHYFDQMLDKNLTPTSNTFNNLLSFLVKSGDFEKSWCFFNEMKSRVVLDDYSFGIMVKGCCENSELKRAFEVFDQMGEMGFSPNVVVYTSLIDGCCKSGDVEKAKGLFCKMGELGLIVNQYTYTVLINGLFKKGLKSEGFELFEKMKEDGVLPDLHTYNSVINVYCKDGELSNAFKLFDEMRERGVTSNVVTYNTLVKGLCRKMRVVEAERLVNEMKRAGVNPSLITYNTLIDGFSNVGKLDQASSFFNEMRSYGLSPSLVTYNVLIAGFARAGKPAPVLDIVRQMEERGICPRK
ncbi:hypothetical protein RJ640_003749 [Escallonia rubra]|uniref:Pentatricopeptide repeat-containing protein n=1 Tax=Escallonia rubra TaxID=112253 RepID=A0AA88RIC9_9ASTE|nr:hypothetical protein RJ640_003749 [Escallonia rubra]